MVIYGNTSQRIDAPSMTRFLNSLAPLASSGASIYPDFANYLESHGVTLPSWLIKSEKLPSAGFVISLGGDGTFLHAAAWSAHSRLPILGINTGHLGYLTAYTLDNALSLADDMAAGRIIVEPRSLLELHCSGIPSEIWPYALNDIAVLKADTSSMIDINVNVNSLYLTDYLADGLLVSTPTGSTGYNLSVGGPIVQPSVPCIVLSPVAPHTLTMRPLVVSDQAELELFPSGRAPICRISLDGRSFTIPCGSKICIRKADLSLGVMRRANQDFASTLRNKLSWGKR